MILTQAVWDKVSITWDEPIPRYKSPDITEETLREVRVFYKDDNGITSLELRWGHDNFMLLARAKVLNLTPWSAKFEAYWWSSSLDNNDYTQFTRGEIVCEF
jgi:hypothetical protein